MNEKKFWIVWNPQVGVPTRKHSTRESAEAEAERLSSIQPFDHFIVLEAVSLHHASITLVSEELHAE